MAALNRHALWALGWAATGLGPASLGYAAWVGAAWCRYGRATRTRGPRDPLLDRFMPEYEVAEQHVTNVAAPPEAVLLAATETELESSPLIRAIFRARAVILGARADQKPLPKGLLALTTSIGWGVLVERPGREIVLGAVTQPWLADVVFRPLAPDAFKDFCEPGYVKIAWTLRADPAGPARSVFRTETRAVATDDEARRRFRWYWARFSPGLAAIRRLMLFQLRRDAGQHARGAAAQQAAAAGIP